MIRDNRRLQLQWRDIPRIYRERLRQLWKIVALNVLAGGVVIASVVLIPLYLGMALLSGHPFWTLGALVIVAVAAANLYWRSLKAALGWKSSAV